MNPGLIPEYSIECSYVSCSNGLGFVFKCPMGSKNRVLSSAEDSYDEFCQENDDIENPVCEAK